MSQGLPVLIQIVGVGIHVDAKEGVEPPRGHHAARKLARSHAKFDADQSLAVAQKAQHILPVSALQRACFHPKSSHFNWVFLLTVRFSRLPTTLSKS